MSSLALDVFRRLVSQVEEVEASAKRAEKSGYGTAAPVLRRAGYVLAVAAIDTFFHEQAVRLLLQAAQATPGGASRVANYCQSVSATDVSGALAESHIRLRLSYRTLVGPRAIESMLVATGRDAAAVWHSVAFAVGSRPDRVQLQLQLFYDRRNQVAHEGDWDFVQLDFRPMDQTHLADCVRFATELAEAMDAAL